MATPQKNTAHEFPLHLVDKSNPVDFMLNPTIQAGDFQVSIDFAAFANLDTLPTVEPAGSSVVKISLSAAEMNGNSIVMRALEVAGGEWEEVSVSFDLSDTTTAQDVWTVQTSGNQTAGSFGLAVTTTIQGYFNTIITAISNIATNTINSISGNQANQK